MPPPRKHKPKKHWYFFEAWFESPQAEQELNLSIPHFMVNTNHSSVVINISSSSCILRGGNSAVGFLGFQGVGFFLLFGLI